MSLTKGPSHVRRHGNTERQRIYYQAKFASIKAKKKDYKSVQDRFLRCTICRQSQLNKGCTEEHLKKLDEPTTFSRIWSSSPQTSSSRTSSNATRPTSCLERRRFGARRPEDRLEVVRHSANTKFFLLLDENRLHGDNLLHGHRHQSGVSDKCFFLQVKVYRLQAMAVPLWATGCVNTTLNPRIRRTPAHDFFRVSQGSRLESSSQVSCVSQKKKKTIIPSHLAQQVARAFVDVSFTIKHHFTFHSFHLHSYPTFYSTANQTFIAVIFTWGFSLLRSIECVFDLVPDSTSPAGYEPNNLIEDNSMEIKQMFFHKPSMTSTYDTSESITTPSPKSDLDYDQIRNILTSPLYLQEGEASAYQSLVYHSFRENLVSSSCHFR